MAAPGPHKRNLYPPGHSTRTPDGDDVVGVKRAVSRAGHFPWQPFDDSYNQAIADAVKKFQASHKLKADGIYGSATHNKLRAQKVPSGGAHAGTEVFDDRAAALYKNYLVPSTVPDLGPVFSGGRRILDQDCTHMTSGLSLYPAFDDCFRAGATLIAPEDLEVWKASSANPGDAFYAHGKSGIDWWFGHLASAPAVGTKIKKGKTIGKVCSNNMGGGPHVHVALNVERLWGKGRCLKHHTNYTHGAIPIGKQLAAGKPK